MYKCEKCGKEFESKRALGGHEATCGKEKPECPICHKKVGTSGFERHLKAHESDHICLQCGKRISGHKKFCSSSCAAKYNNTGHKRGPYKGSISYNILHGIPDERIRKSKPQSRSKVATIKEISGICKNCGKPLSTPKLTFCCSKCSSDYRFKQADERYMSGNMHEMHTLKAHFLAHNPNKCAICGLSEWQGKDIVLVLDHIDGNPENDNPSNLRLICPNCDSQLSTFKGRNRGYGRFSRRQRYKENKSF